MCGLESQGIEIALPKVGESCQKPISQSLFN
jgi:hypothetical protein